MSMRSNAIVQIIESLKLLDSGRSRALKPVIVGILKWMEGKQGEADVVEIGSDQPCRSYAYSKHRLNTFRIIHHDEQPDCLCVRTYRADE